MDNTLDRARQQLAGNVPVDQRATNIVQVLDWNETYDYPNNVPGLCPGNTNNIAVECCAYLELTAGIHRFHIVTDDRAGFYCGATFADTAALSTAAWETPGDTANAYFDIVVEADGLYPVTLLWEETGGGAAFRLYSVNTNDLTEVLINDSTDPTGVVKAWYPVVCVSSSAVDGTYGAETTAVNVLNKVDITGATCGTTVGQKVTGGTLTVPVSGTARFYKLLAPGKTRVTSFTKGTSDVVIAYEIQ
jgi:hypothetical protein